MDYHSAVTAYNYLGALGFLIVSIMLLLGYFIKGIVSQQKEIAASLVKISNTLSAHDQRTDDMQTTINNTNTCLIEIKGKVGAI